MKRLITVVVLALTGFLTLGGESPKSEAAWFRQKYEGLAAITTVTNVTKVGLWSSGDKYSNGLYGYFPKGNGLIVFEDKTWVLIVSHSVHADDGLRDLTMIRTSHNRYFVNRGHVCSTLMLDAPEKIISLETFLKTTGKGEQPEPTKWEEYRGEQSGRAYPPPAARLLQGKSRATGSGSAHP
jgi:hypothetical protein